MTDSLSLVTDQGQTTDAAAVENTFAPQEERAENVSNIPHTEVEIEKLRGEVNTSAARMEGKMDTLLESVKGAMASNSTDFAKLCTDFANFKIWVLGTLMTLIMSTIVIVIRLT